MVQDTRECLARLLDAMLCRICMDRSLDTALFPCGHAVACLDCARRCERCPLCRADIDHCRTIYLPIELMHIDKQSPRTSDESIDSVLDVKSTARMMEQRIQNTISVNNNAIWERRIGLRFNYFRRVLKLFSCGFDRAYWSTNDWESFLLSFVNVKWWRFILWKRKINLVLFIAVTKNQVCKFRSINIFR